MVQCRHFTMSIAAMTPVTDKWQMIGRAHIDGFSPAFPGTVQHAEQQGGLLRRHAAGVDGAAHVRELRAAIGITEGQQALPAA